MLTDPVRETSTVAGGPTEHSETVNPEIKLLLRILEQAFDRKAWHGTTLAGSIRGLDAAAAAWRPAPDRHNIWEIVLHAAYWKYVAHRRLIGGRKGSFPRPGSDWPRLPDALSPAEWKADVALLKEQHRTLREAVAAYPPTKLARPLPPGTQTDAAELIYGVAAHDVYHTGQIQLLKRLLAAGT